MKRVLLLENNEHDIFYFKLKAKGLCEVDVVTNNLDACEKLRSNVYEAAFIDQNLDKMEEGMETVLFILASKLKTKIVMLTGLMSLTAKAASKALNVHLFIEKPITREVIEHILLC